jgi:hypothetical protein
MAFWTKQLKADIDLQPKMKDRFVIIMGGSESTFSKNIMFTAKSVTKPTIDIETKEFKLINHKFKYPGLATWSPIKITMIDMAGALNADTNVFPDFIDSNITTLAANNDSAQKFGNLNFENTAAALAYLLYYSGYDTPRFTAGAGQSTNTATSKQQMNSSLENLTIQQLSHTPDEEGNILVVEEWQIFNPIIKNISWGDLGYGDDGLVEYTIDIDYDFAEISSGGILGGLAEGSQETGNESTTSTNQPTLGEEAFDGNPVPDTSIDIDYTNE